jgi:glycosyltransferase involved in cell wall biosynthesis
VFPNAIIRKTNANLGVARKIGIKATDTEFFVFVDDDIELCDGWFKEITMHIDSTTGAIHGQAVPVLKYQRKWFEWKWGKWLLRRKREAEKVQIITAEKSDAVRGYTHNTLFRKSAVEDWSPSAFLCAYEDHMLLRHVVKRGYTWKIITQLSVKHWGVANLMDELRKARWNIAGARLINFDDLSLLSLMMAVPKETLKAIYASIDTKEPLIIPYVFLRQIAYVQGWIGWNKYLVMKR